MKKLLLAASLFLLTSYWMKAENFSVYENGTVGESLTPYSWWNDIFNLQATNPDGSGKVLEFKAENRKEDNGNYLGFANASMGIELKDGMNIGKLHNATLNFSWYAIGTGTYSVKLTGLNEKEIVFTEVNSENSGKWNTTSLNIAEKFPEVSNDWNNNRSNGNGYVFSLVLSNGKEGDIIYVENVYYSNVDENWEAPEVVIKAPETVPVPTQNASDVLSVFSSRYTPATTFNIGYWQQSTNATLQTIDNQEVYYLRNFNYLGWELNSEINISEYDYMHVDFWTAEPTDFGFTPISRAGTATEKSIVMSKVALEEWNKYDVPLKDWSDAGLDLSKIFQIKFDQGKLVDCYIANVYFWKDENGGGNGDDNGDDDDTNSENTGIASATFTNVWIEGTPENERVDLNITLAYNIVYNEDKTLTITLIPQTEEFNKIVGIVPQIFIDGAYTGDFSRPAPYIFTTSTQYEIGETVTMNFYCAYAGGLAEFAPFTYKVDTTTGVEANFTDSVSVDIYTLSGVRVAKGVNFNEVKSSLTPGFYIVGGKKVIVK